MEKYKNFLFIRYRFAHKEKEYKRITGLIFPGSKFSIGFVISWAIDGKPWAEYSPISFKNGLIPFYRKGQFFHMFCVKRLYLWIAKMD